MRRYSNDAAQSLRPYVSTTNAVKRGEARFAEATQIHFYGRIDKNTMGHRLAA